ncbi:MAG: carboxypeptidase regulatory-like domain-containing protein, partial [Acidobacteria bacterium]|nr:carboxypeptidase regulatory-like domain-containing protein [Acidobacteriota bacterium]
MPKRILTLTAIATLSAISFAQGLGNIVGTINDPSGAAVANAKISAVQSGTGVTREAASNAQGYYVIPSLHPAEYAVTVQAAGFRVAQQNVSLLADQTLTVNLSLQVGASSELIEVNVHQVQVDTTTATLQEVVEQRRIIDLPLNGRNAAQLTLLTAGSVNSPNGGADQGFTKTFPGAVTISANGARQDMVSYQLDGGNYVDEYTNVNQPFPFPDALQEFSVQTSNYTAEYGQNAGAVVNVVTKSGSNNFHGDVFEFLRNSVFNARNYFSPQTTKYNGATVATKDHGRDQIKRNQFGGTLGGPIIHNKTFFFGGIQITRFRNVGSPSNSAIPSTALTATSIPASGPVNSSCPSCDVETYLNGGGTIDPVSLNILKALPLSTNRSITYLKPDNENFREVLGRVDHSISQNEHLTGRYSYNQFHRDPVFDSANFLAYADGATITNQNYLIHETHVFRSNLLNDFRFSYAREAAGRGPATKVPSLRTLGSNIPFQPASNAIQQIRVNGFFNFGDNPQAKFIRNNFAWSSDISWVRGRHDIRLGGVIERSRVDINNLFFQPAEFSLNSLTAFFAGQLGDYGGNFAFRQGAGEFKNNRNIFAGLYAQD